MSSATKRAGRTKASQARGRFVVGSIPKHGVRMLQDCGIAEGDEIYAPNGFPEGMDVTDPPVVEHRRPRTLHPNVAWLLGDIGVLVPYQEPTEADHA